MSGSKRAFRWLGAMAVVVALVAALLMVGQPGAAAQATPTPTRTPAATPGVNLTPTATPDVDRTPTPTATPDVARTPTATPTVTPEITPTEPITPGLPETGVELARVIVVVGEGRAQASPDMASANVGVVAEADTVISATQQVSETMAAVMDALIAEGVAEEDIRTTSYDITVMDAPVGPGAPPTEDAQPRYRVTNSVQVIVRDIEAIGTTIDAAVEAGANQVFGISFEVSDREQYLLEALDEAVQNAEARAQRLAELTGLELGPVVSVSQVIGGPGIPVPMAEAALGLGGGPGPIGPGQLEIVTHIQIVYALQ